MNISDRLRRGDVLLRAAFYSGAVAEYRIAASALRDAGHVLKAVAVLRRVVDVVDTSAPELVAERTGALRMLLECYTALGLLADAASVRSLLN